MTRLDDTPWYAKIGTWLLYAVIIFLMGYPFLFSFSAAVKTNDELVSSPFTLIPAHPSFDNLNKLWVQGDFVRYFRNSLVICMVTIALAVPMCAMSGYVFARRKLRSVDLLFGIITLGMMIPGQVTIIPIYRIFTILNIHDSLVGLILIYLTWTPFGIFLMRTYYLTIPSELSDAARIDGCDEFSIFTRIFFPLAVPAAATVAIFLFMWTWNDFLWPLILLRDPNWFPIQLGVQRFQEQFTVNYSLQNAGIAFAVLPPLIFYLIFRKGIQKGLTAGAIKL